MKHAAVSRLQGGKLETMAKGSKIEWTDHTFNPWIGCQRVAPECDHCYAEAMNQRWSGGANWGPKAPRRRTTAAYWLAPRRWNAASAAFEVAHGRRQRVFCASLADVFDNAVPADWRNDLWALIEATPDLDWMILTKRPQNIARMLPESWGAGWPNVALGVTAGTMAGAKRDIPILQATPTRRRFISVEPLLERVDLCEELGIWWNQTEGRWIRTGEHGIHMMIVGGESGPGARPMHPVWVRSLRDQATAAEVPFMFKQWGEWKPVAQMTDAEADALYLPAPAGAPFARRSPRYGEAVLGMGGRMLSPSHPDAWRHPTDMHVWRIGKARSGRDLDGQIHNGALAPLTERA